MPRRAVFSGELSYEYKNELDKKGKGLEDVKRVSSQRFHFVCLALSKIILLFKQLKLLSFLPSLRLESNHRRHFGVASILHKPFEVHTCNIKCLMLNCIICCLTSFSVIETMNLFFGCTQD